MTDSPDDAHGLIYDFGCWRNNRGFYLYLLGLLAALLVVAVLDIWFV